MGKYELCSLLSCPFIWISWTSPWKVPWVWLCSVVYTFANCACWERTKPLCPCDAMLERNWMGLFWPGMLRLKKNPDKWGHRGIGMILKNQSLLHCVIHGHSALIQKKTKPGESVQWSELPGCMWHAKGSSSGYWVHDRMNVHISTDILLVFQQCSFPQWAYCASLFLHYVFRFGRISLLQNI